MEALEELRAPLCCHASGSFKSGTGFGSYCGTAKGHIGDLVLSMPWTLLVDAEAFQKLQTAGIKGLLGVRAELRFLRGTPPGEFLELQIEPHSSLASSILPPEEEWSLGSVCGYQKLKAPERVVFARASLPTELDLFRGGD